MQMTPNSGTIRSNMTTTLERHTYPKCSIEFVHVVDIAGERVTAKVYNARNEIVDTVTTDSEWSCKAAAEKLVNWLIEKRMIK